jgi:hypothetical protein
MPDEKMDAEIAYDIAIWEAKLPPVWRAVERSIGAALSDDAASGPEPIAGAWAGWTGAIAFLMVAWPSPLSWLAAADAAVRLQTAWLQSSRSALEVSTLPH